MEENTNGGGSYSAVRDALVRELAANERRAKRSLRVLQHQEKRLVRLENELSGKSNLLQNLQESHSDLMEAYHYQEEVHELQKELIKMQEIQYLNEFLQAASSSKETTESEPTKGESFLEPPPSDVNANLNSPNYCQNALCETFPTVETSRQASFYMNSDRADMSKTRNSATDNAILLPEAFDENRMKFGLFKSSLGSAGESLLQNSSSKQPSTFLNASPSTSPEGNDSKSNYLAGLRSVYVENRANGDNENVEQLKSDSQSEQMPSSSYDDGDEKISILKETLSSHRQSIEDLSTEVVQLRKERTELLSYIQNLLEYRNKRDELFTEPKDSLEEMLSKKEIDVIMPVSKNGCKMTASDLESQNYASSAQCYAALNNNDVQTQQSRHVKINVVRSSNSNNCEYTADHHHDGIKLEEKARHMWEKARQFFTPQQAHFILTAPAYSAYSDTEDDEEGFVVDDNTPY